MIPLEKHQTVVNVHKPSLFSAFWFCSCILRNCSKKLPSLEKRLAAGFAIPGPATAGAGVVVDGVGVVAVSASAAVDTFSAGGFVGRPMLLK